MNSTYSRSNSKIIKVPCNKKRFSNAKYLSLDTKGIVRAHGVALDSVCISFLSFYFSSSVFFFLLDLPIINLIFLS